MNLPSYRVVYPDGKIFSWYVGPNAKENALDEITFFGLQDVKVQVETEKIVSVVQTFWEDVK